VPSRYFAEEPFVCPFAGVVADFAGVVADFAGVVADFAGLAADFAGLVADVVAFLGGMAALSVFFPYGQISFQVSDGLPDAPLCLLLPSRLYFVPRYPKARA
jgi:hypothetical protein